jgi:hypothetical protein
MIQILKVVTLAVVIETLVILEMEQHVLFIKMKVFVINWFNWYKVVAVVMKM